MDVPSHPELKYHVEHLDFMLHETRKELDNSRAYANQTHLELAKKKDTINILAKERKSLRHQRAKKDYIIARLRTRIVVLQLGLLVLDGLLQGYNPRAKASNDVVLLGALVAK